MNESLSSLATDPLKFVALCWPDLKLYDKQREILLSVRDNIEITGDGVKTVKTLLDDQIALLEGMTDVLADGKTGSLRIRINIEVESSDLL